MKKNDDFILFLQAEMDKNQPFLNQDYFALTKKMLPYIGDEDPIIRDEIIYSCLAHVSEHLTSSQIQEITKKYIGEDFLFYDIENKHPYSVVTRTFTLLQLAVVVYHHNHSRVLSQEIIEEIAQALIRYLEMETVLQGYDEEVGWLHSLAHAADVLGQLLSCKDLSKDTQMALLDAFSSKVQVNHYTYIDEEDERIVSAIKKGLNAKLLDLEAVEDFVNSLPRFEKQDGYKSFTRIHVNVKNVLRSLYFGLYTEDYQDLRETIVEALKLAKTDKIKKG